MLDTSYSKLGELNMRYVNVDQSKSLTKFLRVPLWNLCASVVKENEYLPQEN
jgi:hypothetical protein